jgi:trehalose/maltose hydrolase-like predicted phosphorylase
MFDSESLPSFAGEEYVASPVAGSSCPARRESTLSIARRCADPKWLLTEEGFTLAREHEVESLFTIGNGYVGNRGSLAEGSALSAPATFVSGVFEVDTRKGSVPGLFVLPDWTAVRVWVMGHPLGMDGGEVLEHRRILDMRYGLLWREWRHRDVNGRITHMSTFRLASLADRHLLVQSVLFTPENYSGEVRLECTIEIPPGVQSSTPPEEWRPRRSAQRANVLPLALRSPGRDVMVALGASSQLLSAGRDPGGREIEIQERRITEEFRVEMEIGTEYRLDRLVAIYTSRESRNPIQSAVMHVNRVAPDGLPAAVEAHASAWQQRWHDADVVLEGDHTLQRALRFAEYHLISAANPEDERVSIGARALTGESYKGHVFWDTELYMVPFYTFTHPASARALLMYRYHLLPAAREKARDAGYRGAMFPWESADNGEETTPEYVIAPGGEVVQVLNGTMEVHISADVAYAVWQYWQATGDDDFFAGAGAELMLETARFWASRGQMESDGRYHLRHVIGPDEYHEDVDDSAYTNLLAAWNLDGGVETARLLQERWPERWREISARLELTAEELESWARLSAAMYIPFDPQTKLYEQFQGFYAKKHVDLLAYEPRNTAMDVILGHEKIQKVDVVKQADVIMAVYLLWRQFPADVREANFRYYEQRTGHGSSLSPSIHALLAARFRNLRLAEKYVKQAAEIDLGNNMGNAAGGVHAAAIGGLWQAIVFGFAGLTVTADALALDPVLLPNWKRLTFPLQWRGRKLRFGIEPDSVRVLMEDGAAPCSISLGDRKVTLAPGQQFESRRTAHGWSDWQELP